MRHENQPGFWAALTRIAKEKGIVIKIIKRKTTPEVPRTVETKPPQTVTSTVKDWIAESRRNRLDRDSSARKTIAGWTIESNI